MSDASQTHSGLFIAIEGGDGAGKSRLQAALAERLASRAEVILTREPGGTDLGEQIRSLVLAQRSLADPLAELLLFEAARAHLVAAVIGPALQRGAIVICDRFTASSIAYQGFGRGLGREIVERANTIATGGTSPDLVLLLDLPVETGLARRAGDGATNHFDKETVAFHERVRDGYRELAGVSDSWCVIDATQPFDAVLAAAIAATEQLLSR
jgi:dTMP kinase